MEKIFTATDLHDQVIVALDGRDGEYHVMDIIEHIRRDHGTVDADTIDSDTFWDIVAEHAIA